MRFTFVVLLYNKNYNESKTLTRLLEFSNIIKGSKVVLWNNGPNCLYEVGVFEPYTDKLSFEFKETVNNESLSKIYNAFIKENNSDFYVILDDDSDLTLDYITELVDLEEKCLIATPIISDNNNFHYPVYQGKVVDKAPKFASEPLFSIGSGLVISHELKLFFLKTYGEVFDERFYFYGVDTSFFYRLFLNKLTGEIKVINGFEHSLSKLSKSQSLSKFRKLERSYDWGMQLRWYCGFGVAIKSLTSLCLKNFLRTVFKQQKLLSFRATFSAYVKGTHYKNTRYKKVSTD